MRFYETGAATSGIAANGQVAQDTGHLRFFRGGIAVVLTLGAAWGAVLLIRIAWSGSFTALGVHEINAHGHAQIFGWVGLFVMGFACFGLPRLKNVPPVAPRLAMVCFWLMASGLVVRSVCQALIETAPWLLAPALLGSLAEILAIAGVLGIVVATMRASAGLTPADGFVLAALGWFLVQAVYSAAYFAATVRAQDQPALLSLVATWQAPLREIQIHGLAMLMILGVSQWILPRFYGTRPIGTRRSLASVVLINVGLIGVVAGLVLSRQAGHAWAGLWYLSVLTMAAATVVLVRGFGLFGPVPRGDRSLKYVRAAYAWLFVSLAMLVILPAYQFGLLCWLAPESQAAEIGFSHAYYGAIRHAVTVGFVSLMIMGVAARVVPEFAGQSVAGLPPLWLPWVLVNAGCTIRVLGQIATDFTPAAFAVTGPSGLLELSGLAVWGVHLWRLMNRSRQLPSIAGNVS